MINLSEEKKEDSVAYKNENKLNESEKSAQEEIKENRKFINYVLRTLTQRKNSKNDSLEKECVDILRNFDRDITRLVDEEKNTFAHILCREEKLDNLKAITKAYFVLIDDKEKFYEWFTLENTHNMTPFDIASQKSNKELIKFLFEIIKKTDESKFKLTQRRNNLFHYAAKRNECFPIVFFYEKLFNVFMSKNINIMNLSNQFGITPLHYACYFGSKKAIDILLDLGGEINEKDQDGNTCLHYAINSGDERTIKKLLIRGADKTIKRNDGKNPYELALESHKFEVANILSDKNIFQKYLCMESEIVPITTSKNHIFLLLALLVLTTLTLLYIFKIENMLFPRNKTENLDQSIENFADCTFDKKCFFEITITFISLLLSFVLISLIVYFICCKGSQTQKKIKRNNSLIDLYEKYYNICVKCRDYLEDNTLHCLVCDTCIEEWDHHCFWLNTCINNRNKIAFKIFFYSIILFVIIEALFIFFNFFLSFGRLKDKFYVLFFDSNDSSAYGILCLQIIWKTIFGISLVIVSYLIIFVTFPIIKAVCYKSSGKESVSGISDHDTRLIARSLNDKDSFNSFSV